MKKLLHFTFRWGLPPLAGIAAFTGGYLLFHRGLSGSTLGDGSPRSFEETAERIDTGKLLEKAAPMERVSWLLEICAQPRSIKRDHALFQAIQQLQPGDFVAAIADLPELSRWMTSMDNDLRADVIQACIERWMDVDEEGLMRWLPLARSVLESETWKLPKIGERDLGAIYGVMARRKPGWLFEQIQGIGPKLQRVTAVRALMQNAVEAGLPQAEAWLASFKGGPDYQAARKTYFTTVARFDPERAVSLTLSELTDDSGLAGRLICECGILQPDLATALLEKLDEKKRVIATQQLANIIAANPAYDGFKWVDDQRAHLLEVSDYSKNANRYWLWSLTARDAPKTMEWLQKLPEASRAEMEGEVLTDWSCTQPKSFLDWLNSHSDVASLQKVMFFGNLPSADPEGFAAWMAKLPPNEMKSMAQKSLAEQWLKKGQIAEAIRNYPADASGAEVLSSAADFGGKLVSANPEEATRWLGTLPPGQLRANAAQGVLDRWLARTPEAATQWVEKLPAGGLRDASAGVIARTISDQDFDGANAWLSEIHDQPTRDRVASQLFTQWQGRRPAQTRDWLQSLPDVSETVRNRLLGKLP